MPLVTLCLIGSVDSVAIFSAPDEGCLRHPHPNATLFGVSLCLPTAPGLPLQGNGDFGTSAFFGQLSDKLALARIRSHGVRGTKRNGSWKIKRWASISLELKDDAKRGRVCGIAPRGWRSVPLSFCVPPIQHIEAISPPSGSTQPCSPGRAQVWPLAYTPQHVLEILPADALGSDLLELRIPDPR